MSAIQRLISFFVPNPSRASVTSLTHLPIRLGFGYSKGLGLGQGWPARWRRAKRSPAGGAPSVRGPGVAAHGLEDFSYIADTARRAM